MLVGEFDVMSLCVGCIRCGGQMCDGHGGSCYGNCSGGSGGGTCYGNCTGHTGGDCYGNCTFSTCYWRTVGTC